MLPKIPQICPPKALSTNAVCWRKNKSGTPLVGRVASKFDYVSSQCNKRKMERWNVTNDFKLLKCQFRNLSFFVTLGNFKSFLRVHEKFENLQKHSSNFSLRAFQLRSQHHQKFALPLARSSIFARICAIRAVRSIPTLCASTPTLFQLFSPISRSEGVKTAKRK